MDASAAELVDAFRFAHEHDFKFVSVRVVVDVLADPLVDEVVLDRDVDCNSGLEVYDVVAQRFNFGLHVVAAALAEFKLLQEFEGSPLSLVELVFELLDVRRCRLQFPLQFLLCLIHLSLVFSGYSQLLLDILLPLNRLLHFVDLMLRLLALLIKSLNLFISFVDFLLQSRPSMLEFFCCLHLL